VSSSIVRSFETITFLRLNIHDSYNKEMRRVNVNSNMRNKIDDGQLLIGGSLCNLKIYTFYIAREIVVVL
jgi:hypothetical protein